MRMNQEIEKEWETSKAEALHAALTGNLPPQQPAHFVRLLSSPDLLQSGLRVDRVFLCARALTWPVGVQV